MRLPNFASRMHLLHTIITTRAKSALQNLSTAPRSLDLPLNHFKVRYPASQYLQLNTVTNYFCPDRTNNRVREEHDPKTTRKRHVVLPVHKETTTTSILIFRRRRETGAGGGRRKKKGEQERRRDLQRPPCKQTYSAYRSSAAPMALATSTNHKPKKSNEKHRGPNCTHRGQFCCHFTRSNFKQHIKP